MKMSQYPEVIYNHRQPLVSVSYEYGEIDIEQSLSKIDLSEPITIGEIGRIINTFQIEYPNIDGKDLLLYPQYVN